MRSQLVVGLVVEALERCVLDGPVHPFDLAVRPWVFGLGCSVLDVVVRQGIFEGVRTEVFAIGDGLLDQRHR